MITALKDDPIYIDANRNGIDVEKLALENFPRWKNFQLKTAVNMASAEIRRKINSINDVVCTGIIVGQNDAFGKKSPMSFPLISSDGKHRMVISYDAKKIPVPGRVELKLRENTDYHNFMITDVLKIEPLDDHTIIERLLKVSKTLDTIDFNALRMSYVKYGDRNIVVMKGTIGWVNPPSKLVVQETDRVTKQKKWARDGYLEVFLANGETEKKYMPVLDISLGKNQSQKTSVTIQLTRQKFGNPIYRVTDLYELCEAAINENPDPLEQAKMVKGGLFGRHVVVVGDVTNLSNKEENNYITMRCYAIYEYEPSEFGESAPAGSKNSAGSLSSFAEDESPKAKPKKEKAKVAEPVPEEVEGPATFADGERSPAQKQATSDQLKQSPKTKRALIESIGDDILQLSRSFDRGAGSFSLDELRKLLKIPQTVPDAVIDEAVKCAILPKPVNDE